MLTTTSITAVSVSIRKAQSTTRSPTDIHCATWTRVAPEPNPTWKNATHGQGRGHEQQRGRDDLARARPEEPPEQACDEEADERQEDDRVIHVDISGP